MSKTPIFPRSAFSIVGRARAVLLAAGFVLLGACSGPQAAASGIASGAATIAHEADTMQQQELEPGDEVLVVGATGSIGELVVAEALEAGYRVRALVRDRDRAARMLPTEATLVVGDLTETDTLPDAVKGVDGIIFVHGASGDVAAREVNYGGVRNILFALEGRPVRVAMMSAVGVTRPIAADRLALEPRGWKRRGERLLRASGLPYTVVRPGWFDYNTADQQRLVFRQGDMPQSGTPRDGAIARRQIARVLVASLSSAAANRTTLELVAEQGAEQAELAPLFSALVADIDGALDGPQDQANLPLAEEPELFRADLQRLQR